MRLQINYVTVIDDQKKTEIRRCFQVDDFSVKRDIDIIKEWIKKQLHFPQGDQDDDFIEKCLLRNKFRVEQTKQCLENYYSAKTTYADLFCKVPSPLPSKCTNLIIPLPDLTDNFERITIVKFHYNNIKDDKDIMSYFKFVLCTFEYSLRMDYSRGHRIIYDLENFTLNNLKKYITHLTPYYTTYHKAYFARIAGFECINAPSFIDKIINIVKTILSEKVFRKITLHKNLESLHKNIKKEYLPKDYGGELKSLEEFLEMWDKEFENNINTLDEIVVKEVTNENLRIGRVQTNESFGINGTFKNLCLD